jgi:hypothetical protein
MINKFPDFIFGKNTLNYQNIKILLISESNLLPENIQQEFLKEGIYISDNSKHVFLTPKKINKFTLDKNSYVEYSKGVEKLDNYLGVASDLLTLSYSFSRKSQPK